MLADVALRASNAAALFATMCLAAASADEEPISLDPGAALSPLVAEALAPLLAEWIVSSRDAAIGAGVQPIPAKVRTALSGYVPEALLDRVRWRENDGDDLTLQQNVIRFGDVPAMTLDHVIVFKNRQDALSDPKLWAHEIKHVMQYAAWGVGGFAARYLRDYEAVEFEAAEFRWQFMKQAGLIPGSTNAPTE